METPERERKLSVDRSELFKERHARAKEQFDLFKARYPNEDTKYSNFLRINTPLEEKIVTFEVSYQVSYRGTQDIMESTTKTFKVIGFRGQESEIQSRTMNMVLDSKGAKTDYHLPVNSLRAMAQGFNVHILPRGMEESERKANQKEVQEVLEKGFSVSGLDTSFKFKNKKGRTATMKHDIRHFIN